MLDTWQKRKRIFSVYCLPRDTFKLYLWPRFQWNLKTVYILLTLPPQPSHQKSLYLFCTHLTVLWDVHTVIDLVWKDLIWILDASFLCDEILFSLCRFRVRKTQLDAVSSSTQCQDCIPTRMWWKMPRRFVTLWEASSLDCPVWWVVISWGISGVDDWLQLRHHCVPNVSQQMDLPSSLVAW